MTTVILELPDDVYNAVRIEAERGGTTPEGRLKRLIESAHRFRTKHPDFNSAAELDRLIESGATKPLADLLPTGEIVKGLV